MLHKLKNRKSEGLGLSESKGFTIIEVLIVLAVAALILLIVLLAVPNLQRNSRNTTIKNDAASVAGAISTFESDNNGVLPTSVTGSSGTVTLTGPAGTQTETIKVNGATVVAMGNSLPGSPGTINVDLKFTCNSAGNGAGTASPRSAALLFLTETSSNPIDNCVAS